MRWKWLLYASIGLVVLLVFSILHLLRQDFDLNRDVGYQSTITIWTTTPRLTQTLKQFQSEKNIRVHVKHFRDMDALVEEMGLVADLEELPDLVEADSFYGMQEIMQRFDPIPLGEVLGEELPTFHFAIAERYRFDGLLYAYPLGMEVPSILVNESYGSSLEGMDLFPFGAEKELHKLGKIQRKMRTNGDFTIFHLDEDIPWYWSSYQLGAEDNADFSAQWRTLTVEQQLVPSLEHRMAITRFANADAATLITSSRNLQNIQKLIGNNFEFSARPFMKREGDPILIAGSGLVVLNNRDAIQGIFSYLDQEKIQLELLSKTGWLPSQSKYLEDAGFIRRLPMAKFLYELLEYEANFSGENPLIDNREGWLELMETVEQIEKEER